MKKIITLTVNPALDKSVSVPELVPDKKLRASGAQTEPGGGGVNVSRALRKLGFESEAVYFSGGYAGKQFDSLLRQEGVTIHPLEICEETRENFIVVDASSGKQYRFGMEGPHVQEQEWKQCLDYLRGNAAMDYLVVSGSLAPGIPPSIFTDLSAIAKEKNARMVVDTSGKALQEAVAAGVFLAKPNLGELAALAGKERLSADEIVAAARTVISRKGCEMIAISMGADGAMLVTETEAIQAKAPAVKMRSTVGAGDSMVAGMLAAMLQGWGNREILCYGIAAGTAATMNEGTELCKKEDTDRLFEELTRN